ncbi:MAG: bifunctional folylpolyglutamate synthase/dihydrofolate synthase [Kiritimatiellae bacterium]|nr:bifunctional folylpolyglutamate synthase/dihydrofolate synthase [Kiritimatiellia bacterium]
MNETLHTLLERNRFGIKPGLETIRAVLDKLGNPETGIAAIHIAGTDGKGAVAAICASVLRAAGYHAGLYISPHLVNVNERFQIDGSPVSDEALEAAAQRVLPAVEAVERETGHSATFFESLTAVAFTLFRDAGVKLAVIETGLGGRLDATNVVTPLVSVITRIGLDHCDWLGNTIAEIAGEKAGIVKPGRPVVCGAMPDEARAVIASAAARLGAPFIAAEDAAGVRVTKSGLDGQRFSISTQNRTLPPVRFPLAGGFQAENAVTALAALECVTEAGLPLTDAAVAEGLQGVCWPGRFQLAGKKPPVLVDGAHNPCAAEALRAALKSCREKRPVALVSGFCGDKDALGVLRILAPSVKAAWGVAIANPRSLTADRAAGLMRMAGLDPVESSPSVSDALAAAKNWASAHDGIVLVCGSLFLAGEALTALDAYPWPLPAADWQRENERPLPGI